MTAPRSIPDSCLSNCPESLCACHAADIFGDIPMKNQASSLFSELSTETASQVRGGWWGYHQSGGGGSHSACGCGSPSYSYGYGQMPPINQTVNVNVSYED
jgi:hypothetical protein